MRNTSNPHAKNNSNVAHNWANGLTNVTKGSNLFFDTDTMVIYSYGKHFPIARNRGGNTYLFTLRTNSVTTAKHMSYVRRAIADNATIIHMLHVVSDKSNTPPHYENILHWYKELNNLLPLLHKARNKAKYIQAIDNTTAQITAYTTYFPEIDKFTLVPELANTYSLITDIDRESILQAEAAQLKTKAAKEITKQAVHIQAFRAGERTTVDGLSNTLLRYDDTALAVRTSRGIKVPVDIAINFYAIIRLLRSKGGCSGDCDGYTIQGYTLERVNEVDIKVGCHTITIDEIEACYKQILQSKEA